MAATINETKQGPDLAALALEASDLQVEIAERTERLNQIKEVLLQRLNPGTHKNLADGVDVQIREGAHRLDAKRLQQAYPAGGYPSLYKLTLDTSAVKRQFAPAALAEFQSQASPSVTIKTSEAQR